MRFTFEVNDGGTLVHWAVWEQSFESNTIEWLVAFTDMVEAAYPSAMLHTSGQAVAVGCPNHSRVVWDGTDEAGRDVAPGVYFCVFEAGESRDRGRLVRLR